MIAVPLTLRQANAHVAEHHRHSLPTVGCKFAVGAMVNGELVGVAIAGRPVARRLDDGRTLEVLRVCTDGSKNACSFLYGRIRSIARLMGYTRVITYTLASEPGASLRAAGATAVAVVVPVATGWCRADRPRHGRAVDAEAKIRWEL